jgi:sec-independent protein translocase protein TatB
MFDFAWSELALIGVVALIAIGPKDMPVAIKAVADMVKKARRMAGEFQTHVDEMVRDANLNEVRGQINEIRNFDFKGAVTRAVDSDGTVRKAFTDDPFRSGLYTPPSTADSTPIETPTVAATPLADAVEASIPTEPVVTPIMANGVAPDNMEAPAFIPPSIASPPVAPAFIPPGTRLPST